MNTRSKLIAAALGLVVATGAIGDVSAKTFVKTTHGAVATKTTKVVTRLPHRVHVGTRLVEHVRFAHRAPLRSKILIVKRPVIAPVVTKTVIAKPVIGTTVRSKIVRAKTFGRTKIVHFGKKLHLAKRPLLEKHAMNHRVGGKTTFIR